MCCTGLMPVHPLAGMERACLDDFLYRHGMYLAVLAAHTAAGQLNPTGAGDALSPHDRRPCQSMYPWQELCGSLPLGGRKIALRGGDVMGARRRRGGRF